MLQVAHKLILNLTTKQQSSWMLTSPNLVVNLLVDNKYKAPCFALCGGNLSTNLYPIYFVCQKIHLIKPLQLINGLPGINIRINGIFIIIKSIIYPSQWLITRYHDFAHRFLLIWLRNAVQNAVQKAGLYKVVFWLLTMIWPVFLTNAEKQ